MRRSVVNKEHRLVVKPTMAITLSAYHRAIDDVLAARVLDDVCPALEEPESVIL